MIAAEAKRIYKSRWKIAGIIAKSPDNIGEEESKRQQSLFEAINACDLYRVSSAITKGAKINYKYKQRGCPFGSTPLLIAISVASETVENHSGFLQEQQESRELVRQQEESLQKLQQDLASLEAQERFYNTCQRHEKLTRVLDTKHGLEVELDRLQTEIVHAKNRQKKFDKNVSRRDGILSIVRYLILKEADLIYVEINGENAITILENEFGSNEQIWPAVQQRPDLVDIYRWYIASGTKFKISGEVDNAIRYYKKAATLMPSEVSAWGNLGLIHGACGEYNKAIRNYNTALGIDPNNGDLLNGLGLVYQKKGGAQEAHEYYAKARDVEACGLGMVISIFDSIYSINETEWLISMIAEEIIILERVEGKQRIVEYLFVDEDNPGLKREALEVTNNTALLMKLKEKRLIQLENPLIAMICSKRVTREQIENLSMIEMTLIPNAQEWARDLFTHVDGGVCARARLSNPR